MAEWIFADDVMHLHEKRMSTHSLKPWRHPIKLERGNLVGDNYHHSLDIFPLKSLHFFRFTWMYRFNSKLVHIPTHKILHEITLMSSIKNKFIQPIILILKFVRSDIFNGLIF